MKIWATLFAATVGAVTLATVGYAQEGAKALFYTGDGSTVMAKPSQGRAAGSQKPTQANSAPAPQRAMEIPTPGTYLGIKYWIVLVGKDGRRSEVAADRVFGSGDRIKIQLETNRDGYLYLINAGSTGRYHLLFPHPKVSEGSNLVKARTVYDVPYDAFIRFDNNPGEETLLILLSPYPMSDLAVAADPRTRAVPQDDGKRIVTTALARGAKDLTLEMDTAVAEPRGYAVTPLSTLGDGGMLVLELKLRHK